MGFQILRCFMYWSSEELQQVKPAQHKHVVQRMTIKMYEETILPIYKKANIKLLSKTKVLALNTGLYKEYQ